MSTLDTTKGPLLGQSLKLALPAVVQAILINCYAFNDYFFVGLLHDSNATAALGACFALVLICNTLLGVFPVGAMSLMSQAFGAQRLDRVADVFRQAAAASLVWSAGLGVFGILGMGLIVGSVNVTPAVGAELAEYMAVIFVALPLFALMRLVTGTFYACGNTRLPLAMEFLSLGINTALNYVLVLGAGPIPSMGIWGAGVATALSRTAPGVIGLWFIWRRSLGFELKVSSWSCWCPKREDTRNMAQVGFYEAISGLLYGVVYLMLNRIAGQLGSAAQGGLGAGLRGIEWIAFAFGDGFAKAAIAIVGQNVGAGQTRRAWRGAWLTAGMSAFSSQLVGVLFLVYPAELSAIVTHDPKTLNFAARYVEVIGHVMWAVGFEMAMYGALIGSGKPAMVLWVSGLANLLRIPLAVVFVFGAASVLNGLLWTVFGVGVAPSTTGGFDGLSWTIAITALIKAGFYGSYFAFKRDIGQVRV